MEKQEIYSHVDHTQPDDRHRSYGCRIDHRHLPGGKWIPSFTQKE